MIRRIAIILEMIKFEHTLFALPYAAISAGLALRGMASFPTGKLLWILAAMVGARSSAMAFNRIVDVEIDRRNPRTATRALPAGTLTLAQVWVFTACATALFVLAAGMLNRLALMLSPVALAILWGYSYTKRFTTLSHWVLGLALGIAPVGAWIALRGQFALPPIVLCAAVMLWTAGFDIIYSCQDCDFDRKEGLFSLPAKIGMKPALAVSSLLHVMVVGLLLSLHWLAPLGSVYLAGVAFVAILFVYEHSLVKPDDLTKVNAAFFTTNGFVSVGLMLFALADLWL